MASSKRVAVIAIHGVSDHQRAEMCNGVGDLLADLDGVFPGGSTGPRYTAFEESTVRLNVAPLVPPERAFPSRPGGNAAARLDEAGTWGPMGAIYRACIKGKLDGKTDPEWDTDHLLMEGQIAQYKGERPEDTYESHRLRAVRKPGARSHPLPNGAGAAIPAIELDVYDMFWSDLSKLNTAFTQVFGELYQLLFHLGSVGLNNVRAAAIDHLKNKPKTSFQALSWRFYCAAEWLAAATLAWPIAFLNLLMVAAAFTLALLAIIHKLPLGGELFATTLLITALAAIALGLFLLSRRRIGIGLFGVLGLMLVLGLAAQAYLAVTITPPRDQTELLAAPFLFLALMTGVFALVRLYDRRRPGSLWVFGVVGAAWLVASYTLSSDLRAQEACDYLAMRWSLRLIDVGLWALLGAWFVFGMAFVGSYLVGLMTCLAGSKDDAETRDRSRRTHRTGWVTLAVSAAVFLVISTVAWVGLSRGILALLPPNAVQYQPLLGDAKAVGKWANDSLISGGVADLLVLAAGLTLASVLGLWGFGPVVWSEVSPPRGDGETIATLARKSTALGTWLDNGYSLLAIAGYVIGFSVSILPLVAYLMSSFSPIGHSELADKLHKIAAQVLEGICGIALGGAGLLMAQGKLQNLAGGFRPAVRVALDVDNWLREHPRQSNPTARICGRYTSLLRHIVQGGADKKPYDAIIIFAHSQGTVITTDLLRFLKVEQTAHGSIANYDPELASLHKPKIYLFTMGCPLRQLYGLRFPYLYGYGRNDLNRGVPLPSQPTRQPARILANEKPDPAEFGITQWVNAYRSGDYIGRYLWGVSGVNREAWTPVGPMQTDWNPSKGVPLQVWFDDQGNGRISRLEFSIGPGAHTHYWDSTAQNVAEALDALISRASLNG